MERQKRHFDDIHKAIAFSNCVVDTKKNNKLNERIMKPQAVLDYNGGKQGIDLSDQLSAYDTCLRGSVKWYQKRWHLN